MHSINYITVVMNLTLRSFTFSIQMHTKTGDERISQDQIYLIFPLDHHRALLQQETDEGDMKKWSSSRQQWGRYLTVEFPHLHSLSTTCWPGLDCDITNSLPPLPPSCPMAAPQPHNILRSLYLSWVWICLLNGGIRAPALFQGPW